jgi:hypothetical protein
MPTLPCQSWAVLLATQTAKGKASRHRTFQHALLKLLVLYMNYAALLPRRHSSSGTCESWHWPMKLRNLEAAIE